MGTYQLMNINENSPEYQGAMEIHRQILANGTIAASAMVELCKNLKIMRDRGSFIHLGYQTFDDYCEQATNIKKRQAYNYISTYERLGPEVLQSNAQLGITKLQLLSAVSEDDRDDLLASGQAEDMSTRQLKDLTEELTKAREQISFLQEGLDSAAAEIDKADSTDQLRDKQREVDELLARIRKMESEQKKAAENTEVSKKAAAKEIEADIKKKLQAKVDKDIAAAKAEADKKAEAARQEGIKAGREAAERGLQAVEKEKTEALAKARELEKKLQVQGNQDSIIVAHLFTEFQDLFNKIKGCIDRIAAADPEAGQKYIGAMKKFITMMDQKL